MDRSNFPIGISLSRLIGTSSEIHGHRLTIHKICSERAVGDFNERWAVFDVLQTAESRTLIMKVRYECDPIGISESDLKSMRRQAVERFKDECGALKACEQSRSTPTLYASEERLQRSDEVCPGQMCRIIVMSKVPGSDVYNMLGSLPFEKKAAIRTKLVELLEYIRLQGYFFYRPETAQIFYDRETEKVSLIGFSRAGKEIVPPERGKPIKTRSVAALGFGVFSLQPRSGAVGRYSD